MIQVTKNVYVEENFAVCNVGLITTKEGNVLVDSPIRPTDAVKWRDEVLKKGKVQYLINTEEHPDHWLGTRFLPGTLISSRETRNILANTPAELPLSIIKRANPEGLPISIGYSIRLADITFSGAMDIYLGDHTIKLLSLPGHCPGGIGVYLPEERVVFTSDTVFHGFQTWLKEAVPEHWLESLRKLSSLDIDVVVPGHGKVCKKEYLAVQTGIVQGWMDVVKSAVAQGWSKDESIARIINPDPNLKDPRTPGTEKDLNRDIITNLYQLYSRKT